MIKNISSSDISINSFIGEKTSLKGIFSIKGPLRIDGNFSGKIESTGKVIIGKNGRAECIIIAKTVTVGGTVKGDVIAEDKVNILKSAEIIGNIFSSSVNMDDGVIFNGKCKIMSKDQIRELIESKKAERVEIN